MGDYRKIKFIKGDTCSYKSFDKIENILTVYDFYVIRDNGEFIEINSNRFSTKIKENTNILLLEKYNKAEIKDYYSSGLYVSMWRVIQNFKQTTLKNVRVKQCI